MVARVIKGVGGFPWSWEGALYAGLLILSAVLWWLCAAHPSVLPVWAPWDFAPLQFLSMWLTVIWYARGTVLSPSAERPSAARQVAFYLGMAVIYTVLQTRFEYMAEHMFFLNRIQHIAMHHAGPLLVVLAWPGAMIKRGMPQRLARMTEARWLGRVFHVLQQPLLASFLFVGLIYLWLIPPVHFRAMIDPRLYAVMNWSMVVDGILFWCLILDPRPAPPARISFMARAGTAIGVMFPQIVLGAMITFSSQDLYGFYHWCGRIYPNIGTMRDQLFGGLIVWIPGAMMSVLAMLLVLNYMRKAEDKRQPPTAQERAMARAAARWTGR